MLLGNGRTRETHSLGVDTGVRVIVREVPVVGSSAGGHVDHSRNLGSLLGRVGGHEGVVVGGRLVGARGRRGSVLKRVGVARVANDNTRGRVGRSVILMELLIRADIASASTGGRASVCSRALVRLDVGAVGDVRYKLLRVEDGGTDLCGLRVAVRHVVGSRDGTRLAAVTGEVWDAGLSAVVRDGSGRRRAEIEGVVRDVIVDLRAERTVESRQSGVEGLIVVVQLLEGVVDVVVVATYSVQVGVLVVVRIATLLNGQ